MTSLRRLELKAVIDESLTSLFDSTFVSFRIWRAIPHSFSLGLSLSWSLSLAWMSVSLSFLREIKMEHALWRNLGHHCGTRFLRSLLIAKRYYLSLLCSLLLLLLLLFLLIFFSLFCLVYHFQRMTWTRTLFHFPNQTRFFQSKELQNHKIG